MSASTRLRYLFTSTLLGATLLGATLLGATLLGATLLGAARPPGRPAGRTDRPAAPRPTRPHVAARPVAMRLFG